jgi:cytochrome c peroxidase
MYARVVRMCPIAQPDAAQGSAHLRDVFGRMGLNDQEIVALSGAHAIGRCHTDRSGFWGPWTYGEAAFSNEYFTALLNKKWTVKKTHEGQPWKGPKQFEADGGKLMMLPTDMVLLDDPEFKKWVVAYAKDEGLFFRDFAKAFQKLTELGFCQ